MKKAILTLGAFALLVSLGAVVAYQAAPARASADKVTLCHLADGPAQAGLITVAAAAAYNGHYLQHSADIIPPFEYQGETYSLNWTGSFPEECAPVAGTDTGGTTTDDPPPPPDDVCTNIPGIQEVAPVGYHQSTVDPPLCYKDDTTPICLQTQEGCDDPPVTGIDCPVGEAPWKGKCYPVDAQKQPDGSVIYGEQG